MLLRDVPLPLDAARSDGTHVVIEGVVCGALPLAIRDLNRWRRLLASENVPFAVVIGDTPAACRALFPPSEMDNLLFVSPNDIPGGTSFAAVVANGRASALVTGPPMESDWESFRLFF